MSDKAFPELPFDDSEAVEFDNTPAPEGDYTLRLDRVNGKLSSKGTPMVEWGFKITDDADNVGKFVWHSTPTTGRGAGMTKAVVSGFGYDWDEWFESVGRTLSPEALYSLIGEDVDVRLRINVPDEDTLAKWPNAKERNEIANIYR